MPRRPTAPLLVVPLLALAACSFSEPDGTAAATRDRVLAEADRTVPLVAEALEATEVVSTAQWESCMGYPSWKYAGSASLTVPGVEGVPPDREQGLEVVRTALADAGYDDTRAMADKVIVSSEGYGLVVQYSPAREKWFLEFTNGGCVLFDDADNELVAQDGQRELDLAP